MDHVAKWTVTEINNLTTQTSWFISGVKLFAITFSLKVRRNLTCRNEMRTREVNFNHSCQIHLFLTHSCSLYRNSEGINSTLSEKQNNAHNPESVNENTCRCLQDLVRNIIAYSLQKPTYFFLLSPVLQFTYYLSASSSNRSGALLLLHQQMMSVQYMLNSLSDLYTFSPGKTWQKSGWTEFGMKASDPFDRLKIILRNGACFFLSNLFPERKRNSNVLNTV